MNSRIPTIAAVRTTPTSLQVSWADGTCSSYPWFWLRDHATDPDSFDPGTGQRELNTATVAADIQPEHLSLADDAQAVQVHWPDASAASVYPVSFLWQFADRPDPAGTDNGPDGGSGSAQPLLWQAATAPSRAEDLQWSALVAEGGLSPQGRNQLTTIINRWGFALITGCPPQPGSVGTIAKGIGYVRETLFGGIWQFEANARMADSAYSAKELRPHTDGTYSHDAPGLQLLLCCAYEATGGASILVDGAAVLQQLRRTAPDHLQALTSIKVPGQYLGDGVHLRAERPVFRCDGSGGLVQVSYNNYDRAPFRLDDTSMARFYAAIRAFDTLANDPAMQWRRVLQPGELLVFDNWRVLHGRSAFVGSRRMAGCYLNREDFESALRLGAASTAPG